jgi:hypothetical protein
MKTQVISLPQLKDALESYALFGPTDAHIFASAKAVRVINGVRVHAMPFKDTESAYDWSQSAIECKDGDLIVCGNTVAVMVSAWPTAVCGDEGVFHVLSPALTWDSYDEGKYAAAVSVARRLNRH